VIICIQKESLDSPFYLLYFIVMTPEQLNQIADLIAKSLED
jgi:hypothetical protein